MDRPSTYDEERQDCQGKPKIFHWNAPASAIRILYRTTAKLFRRTFVTRLWIEDVCSRYFQLVWVRCSGSTKLNQAQTNPGKGIGCKFVMGLKPRNASRVR
jgi:hypothetical protein